MTEPRLKSGLWVAMALRMGDLAGQPGVVVRRGDADAGGIVVLLRGQEGCCVLTQVRTRDGEPAWMRGTGPVPVDDATADAYLARQASIDPDVWVVEFTVRDLVPPFEGRIV